MKYSILIIFLLCLFAVMAVTSITQKSGTCDEIAHHIPSGAVIISKGDFKMSTESPPLPRCIIALPSVTLLQSNIPDDMKTWRNENRAVFGRDFFFRYNSFPKKMLFYSRMPVILIGILCGLVLFLWAKQMYGKKVGFFTLFLYSFSPNILAHARLATTDMIATFFMILSIFSFWIFIKKQTTQYAILAGLCLGFAQLSKYSMLILYPIFILLFVIAIFKYKETRGGLSYKKLLLIFLVSVIVVWAGYGFRIEPVLHNAMRAQEKLDFLTSFISRIFPLSEQSLRPALEHLLMRFPVPFGEHLLGVLGVLKHSYQGHTTYFLGEWSSKGNPFYFLACFLLKTPIPLIIFISTGIVTLFRKKLSINEYFLLLPILTYFIFASRSNLQIGVRHILPIYPLCFVLAAQSIDFFRFRITKQLILIFSIWYVASSFIVWPHYLSYFNEAAGGPNNGWRYLRDSNVDWGQDLPALSAYIKDNNINKVVLTYFGEDSPEVYGINYRKLMKHEYTKPGDNVYAISVQYLDSVNWAKEHPITAKAGYSIFIYDLRKQKI